MTLLAPAAVASPLAHRNPLATMGAALVVMLGLLATVDPLTPAVLLAVELALLPAAGLPARLLARRTWPLVTAALGVGLANVVAGTGLDAAGSVVLRLLALALPGVVVVATIEPVDLADALVQQLRAPARFAYGALAALRLLPLLGEEWQALGRARRARGIDAGRSPVAAVRLFGSRVFALLVGAVRRGTRLATAMDARGFGTGPRTFARRQRMRPADWAVLLGAVAVVTAATLLSVAVGTWHPLFG